jgi:hypothetical protein
MAKEHKTARELEAMILQEAKDWRLRVSVQPDQAAGWHATAGTWGRDRGLVARAQQIAQRLRTQYDLKEE